MASIDSRKRKLREDGANAITKSHKRHRSDHTPIPAIDYQAQLRNGKTSEAFDIASVAIAPPVKEVAKRQRDSDKTPRSSADPAPTVKPAKASPSEKTAQKQKVSSAEVSSSDEGDDSFADLATTDPDKASNVALVTASISPSEEAFGEEGESEEDDYDDQEEEVGTETSDKGTQARRQQRKARHENILSASDPESDTGSESSMEWASDAVLESDDESHPETNNRKKELVKADDPSAFATSMSAILSSNLTRTQRANPILARSADAKEAESALLDRKLEKKVRAEMKREKGDKGGWEPGIMMMIKDDVHVGESLGETGEIGPHAAYQRREKELRKMAQRGVVKMFNAFAHVREKAVEAQGVGGSRAKREEKATEMTKEGWLEYVGLGGKGKVEEKGKKGKSDQT